MRGVRKAVIQADGDSNGWVQYSPTDNECVKMLDIAGRKMLLHVMKSEMS